MDLEKERQTATPAPRRHFRRPTVSVSTTAMTDDTQRVFEQFIIDLISRAVCDQIEKREESDELQQS